MTVEELLNRLKEIQDQLDEIEPGPDDAPLYDVQDLIYRLMNYKMDRSLNRGQ